MRQDTPRILALMPQRVRVKSTEGSPQLNCTSGPSNWDLGNLVASLTPLALSYVPLGINDWAATVLWCPPSVSMMGGVWSAAVCWWMVHVRCHPHLSQSQRLPSRTLHCDKVINVIYFTYLTFQCSVWWVHIHVGLFLLASPGVQNIWGFSPTDSVASVTLKK